NPESSISPDQSELRVAKVSPRNAVPASPAVERVAVLKQAPDMPKPSSTSIEARTDNRRGSTESIPPAVAEGISFPLTNSSYLPANPDSYCFRCGVKCPPCGCNPGGPGWAASRPIPWE